jgi:hypothetical protein
MKKLATLLIGATVVLAACTTATSEDTTTTQSGDATTTTSSPDAGGSGTTSPESTTTTVGSDSDGASTELGECVVGVWELDAQSFFEQLLAAMPPDEQLGEFAVVAGRYVLAINADGTFSNDRDDWTLSVVSEFGELEIRINSTQSGTYVLDGDQLTTKVSPGDPPDVEFFVDGEPMVLPGGVVPIAPPEAEFSGARVSCEGDVLTATANDFTSTWVRTG